MNLRKRQPFDTGTATRIIRVSYICVIEKQFEKLLF